MSYDLSDKEDKQHQYNLLWYLTKKMNSKKLSNHFIYYYLNSGTGIREGRVEEESK